MIRETFVGAELELGLKTAAKHDELSPEALELVAERFRVLGEPLRLRLLQRLQHEECSVGALAARTLSAACCKVAHGASSVPGLSSEPEGGGDTW